MDDKGKILLKKGDILNDELLATVPYKYWAEVSVGDPLDGRIRDILKEPGVWQGGREARVRREVIAGIKKGDELPPGVIKMVKVYVAIKRKLAVGDKMAGRHGNKGVVSGILPEEDLPYLEDGRPVDIVLNPLGVPSRMNIGQILESHLGWAAKGVGEQLQRYIDENYSRRAAQEAAEGRLRRQGLRRLRGHAAQDDEVKLLCQRLKKGIHVATPVFDGARETEIHSLFDEARLPRTTQVRVLFDGRTGEPFDQNVTVGVMYILKLHHLVDEKIHAQWIGPYSSSRSSPWAARPSSAAMPTRREASPISMQMLRRFEHITAELLLCD